MGADERAIREVHAVWIDAVNGGDLERLLGLMTDDVLFLSPGRAPIGRAEFPAGFSAAHRESVIHCRSELQEVLVGTGVGYTVCRDSLSVAPRLGGEAMMLAGHRVSIYHRQPDGRWRLARDIHTLAPTGS